MKTYKKKMVRVEDEVFCDLCKEEIRSDNEKIRSDKFKEISEPSGYETVEFYFYHYVAAYSYPECRGGEKLDLDVDICPKCFEAKVVPVLRDLFGKVSYEEIED